MTELIKLLDRNFFFEKENIERDQQKVRMKFVLQPICPEKKSNWIYLSVSVVILNENFDVIGHIPKLMVTNDD